MDRIKTFFRVLLFVVIGGFLHYTLPQHDIVRVTSTEIIRTDFSGWNRIFFASADAGSAEQNTRDLRLLNTQKQDTWLLGFVPRETESVMVYRNEDTGWGWPFYFKFDSADLQAEAANLARGDDWAVITHYGWRVRWASIYPNAVSIRPVAGPDVSIIPWFNIGFFIFLGIAALFVRAMWRQFLERSVDPLIDKAEHQIDEVQAGVAKRRGRLARWWRKE
ncbi:DUF1523 family protein [Yoonia litorea]|uniref:DUF1523 domain-containing protein n=1 Tax=Yoonia litorea TaxID=1123755 RepID=A0A1I6N143_9RHOB|nr:DUF1523 family protein [Yoonia litorea]SFS21508.1 Protein of unknown function [Yoonia litorea]